MPKPTPGKSESSQYPQLKLIGGAVMRDKEAAAAVRRVILYLLTILLGYLALNAQSTAGNLQLVGVLLLAAGMAGAGFEARFHLKRLLDTRARAREREHRIGVKRARRTRTLEKRDAERAERDRIIAAEALRQEQRRLQSRAGAALATRASERTILRETALEKETARIRNLTDEDLIRECIDQFTAKGWRVAGADAEAPFDLILTGARNPGEMNVVRCAPVRRAADIPDIIALDAWRSEIGASRGFLISIAGFTARAALHLARTNHLITPVEPHMLALWKVPAEIDESE